MDTSKASLMRQRETCSFEDSGRTMKNAMKFIMYSPQSQKTMTELMRSKRSNPIRILSPIELHRRGIRPVACHWRSSGHSVYAKHQLEKLGLARMQIAPSTSTAPADNRIEADAYQAEDDDHSGR